MATLNEIIYDTLGTIKGTGKFSDDNDIPIQQVEYIAINVRAFLIRQDQAKGRSISDNITQILPCVPVQVISTSQCPCYVPIDCTVVRTVNKIPKPIETQYSELITKVSGSEVTAVGWSIISFARASVSGTSKFTDKNPKAFFNNGYIYVINAPAGLEYISISLVQEDPRESANILNCSGTPCYSNDDRFPISNYMIPTLKELILKDLKIQIQAPIDYKGDEKNKSEPQV